MAAKKKHHRGALLAGVGILAAVMGGRLLSGKAGAKNRKRLEGWAEDLKEDALAVLGDAQVLSKKAYLDAVDRASKKYKKLKNIDEKDVEKAVREIKGHWNDVEARLAKTKKVVKKVTRKTVRKVRKATRS